MKEFLEIMKYILPSLVVFMTVYFVIKQYLTSQYNLQYLKTQQENAAHNVPIKLQAYERLILLVERMRLSNLLYRLRDNDITVKNLTASMLISIEKEFEHNQAQQLYVSNNLWKIINLAKNNTQNIISESSVKFSAEDNSGDFANALLVVEKNAPKSAIDLAINAIKEEAKMILNTNS